MKAAFANQRTGASQGAILHPAMAMAVVGGINEMVLQSIEQGRAGELAELVAPAAALLRAAVVAQV